MNVQVDSARMRATTRDCQWGSTEALESDRKPVYP